MNRSQNEFYPPKLNLPLASFKPFLQLQTPVQTSAILQALLLNKKRQALTTRDIGIKSNIQKLDNPFLKINQIPIHSPQIHDFKPLSSPSTQYILDARKQNNQHQRAQTSKFMQRISPHNIVQQMTSIESVGDSTNAILIQENNYKSNGSHHSIYNGSHHSTNNLTHHSTYNGTYHSTHSAKEENFNKMKFTLNKINKASKFSRDIDKQKLKLNLDRLITQRSVQDEDSSKCLTTNNLESHNSRREIIEDLTKNNIIKLNKSKILDYVHYSKRNKDTVGHLKSFTISTARPLSSTSTKNTLRSTRFSFFPADRSISMAAPSTQRRPLTSLVSKRNANSPQKVQFLENAESKSSSKLIFGIVSAVKLKNKFKRAASAINLKRNQISVFDESKSIIPSIVMNDDDSQKKEENIGLEEKIRMINQRYKELH